jgi:hypothetical protein
MTYQIDTFDDQIRIEFNGALDALDLILLNQSPAYKTAIENKKKMLIDFTGIEGSKLTAEDAKGLAMFGQLDSERVKNLHLVIAVEQDSALAILHICEKVFSDSSWKVDTVDTLMKAKQLLSQ